VTVCNNSQDEVKKKYIQSFVSVLLTALVRFRKTCLIPQFIKEECKNVFRAEYHSQLHCTQERRTQKRNFAESESLKFAAQFTKAFGYCETRNIDRNHFDRLGNALLFMIYNSLSLSWRYLVRSQRQRAQLS